MVIAKKADRAIAPPYVAYNRLRVFLDACDPNALPDHVDRSWLPGDSFGGKSQLLSTLRFLRLIDEFRACTPALRSLVKAWHSGVQEKWRKELKAILDAAYADVVDETLLGRCTPKQLANIFREAGVSGHSVPRAMRFYFTAMEECGVRIPAHLPSAVAGMVPRRPRGATGRKPGRPRNTEAVATVPAKTVTVADSTEVVCQKIPVYLGPGRLGHIEFPEDVTREECAKFHAAVNYLAELFVSRAKVDPEE